MFNGGLRYAPQKTTKMIYKTKCPQCGAQILGKPRCERDEHGNLYQIIDYTCPCGYAWICNPDM